MAVALVWVGALSPTLKGHLASTQSSRPSIEVMLATLVPMTALSLPASEDAAFAVASHGRQVLTAPGRFVFAHRVQFRSMAPSLR